MAGKELIEIEIALDPGNAVATVNNLTSMIERLGAKRTKIQLDDGRVVTVAQRIKELRTQIDALKAVKKLRLLTDSEVATLKKAESELRLLERGLKNADTSAKTLGQTFRSISASISHVGGAMQSMGNALTRFTSPLRGLMRGTVLAAGYKMLNTVTSGLSGAFERYDVMHTYQKTLEALEFDDVNKKFSIGGKEAMTALDNLNESVLGLPTGLDEIVAMQKMFAGATGEMEKSTKSAIATNNAFLASTVASKDQKFIKKYINALVSGADLASTQWSSMIRIMPLAMRAVSDELGYEYKEFQELLQSGQIASEDFLNAFIKVGTEGKVQAAANVMKTTWSGLAANTSNAFKRMGENILKAFDDMFMDLNGRNLIQNLLGFDAEGNKVGRGLKDVIDEISASIQNWIRSNPDKILDFINSLMNIDWLSIGRGMAEGLGEVLNFIQMFADKFGGKDLSGIGKTMVRLSWIGKALTIAGGVVKGLRHPIALLATGLGALISKAGKFGIFAKIASIFGNLTGLKKAKKVADEVPGFGTSLKRAFSNVADTLLHLATIAVAAGTGFVVVRSVKTMIRDLKSIADELNTMTPEQWDTAAKVLYGMVVALAAFEGVASAIGGAMTSLSSVGSLPTVMGGVAVALVGALGALVSAEVMSVFKSFELATKYLKNGLSNIEELGNISFNKGRVEKALGVMKDIMSTFDASYDEGGSAKEGTGKTHADWSANSKKFKNVTKDIADAVQSMKDILEDLNTLPDMDDKAIETATGKVENAVESMKSIYKKLMDEIDLEIDKSKGSEKWQRSKNEGVIKAVADIVKTIKDSMDDLKALEKIDVNFEQALGNARRIGEAMGSLFASLNEAFGQELITDSDGTFVQKTNQGVTPDQKEKAKNLKELFDSYKESLASIRSIYESLMGKEDDMKFEPDAFKSVMEGITGEEGILAQLKTLWDGLLDEKTGFGKETDIDLEGIMDGFAKAVGSIKDAVTTLQEIGEVEFEGDGGIGSVVGNIKQMIQDITNAFDEDVMGQLSERIEAFKTKINELKTAIESLGGGEGGEGIKVSIEIVPEITGDDETVQKLQDAHDAIKEQIDAIKALSGAIKIKIPISASLPGLNRAVNKIYRAASRLAAAKAALNSAKSGIYVSTGGYIGSGGKVLYRSKGGDTTFKPRGTDTIPAMLSPGEYVTRRQAVDFFGIDFMQKVNRMDVQGALRSLMARATGMASTGTTINNYNNQKVIINNGSAGAGFTFKQAGRFVGVF